jgi:hypothetical protein
MAQIDGLLSMTLPPEGVTAHSELLYRAILRRSPDAAAMEEIQEQFEAGSLTRARLTASLIQGSEFAELQLMESSHRVASLPGRCAGGEGRPVRVARPTTLRRHAAGRIPSTCFHLDGQGASSDAARPTLIVDERLIAELSVEPTPDGGYWVGGSSSRAG